MRATRSTAAAAALRAGPSSPSRASAATTSPPLAADESAVGGAALPQAPGGQAVRRPGPRPRHGPVPGRGRRGRGAGTDLPARADRPAPPPAGRPARGVGRAGQPVPRRAAPLHPAAPPARCGGRRADRADQRERVRRADRLPRTPTPVGLASIADAVLTHDRAIHTRADDSVVRVERGRVLPIRRSRGYAPRAAHPGRARPPSRAGLRRRAQEHVLPGPRAARVPVAPHRGPGERRDAALVHRGRRALPAAVRRRARRGRPRPASGVPVDEVRARAGRGVELVGVQHHHAHLASCLADNGEAGPVIGVAFDGLGYGTDGALWGGEVLEVSLTGVRAGRPPRDRCRCPAGRPPSASRGGWRRRGCGGRHRRRRTSPVARRNPGWAAVGRLLDSPGRAPR